MKSVTFRIEGMHCGGCAQNIKALVAAETGVRAADISYDRGEGRILYDPQAVTEDQLIATIQKAGYKVPARDQ